MGRALFLGGVYGHKRPEFLIESAEHLRALIPDFEMLVIGDGSSGHLMSEAAERYSWFHHAGACYGDEKVVLASVASLQLMPGLVGLNVVDAFAMGIPTITTDINYHSPEIEYLIDGVNGVMTPTDATPAEFATETANLLRDKDRLKDMQAAALASGSQLSIENMARRFADGVVQALL